MEKKNNLKPKNRSSENEVLNREDFFELYKNTPIPDSELLENLGLYVKRQDLSRFISMNELYKKIINVHGIVIEFGTRWGQNLVLFQNFRGMYEPFNYSRKIVGFDTFEGFLDIHDKDNKSEDISKGILNVTEGYENYLEQILGYHESESPISHVKKFEIRKGDASVKIIEYLEEFPETIIALVYFDMDLYKPTKDCLLAIQNHLTKGSIIGFDELNHHIFYGETVALKEVFGLDKYKIQRSSLVPFMSWMVIK